jgi:hypothetical protein
LAGAAVIANGDILSAFSFVTVLVMLSFFLSPTAFSPLQTSINYDSMARPQFRLLDIGVLVIQIQLVAALCLSAEPEANNRAVALVWLCVPLSMWWFGGVRLLSCAGIERTWHRIFFLSVVAPLGFFMAFSLSSVLLLLMYAVYTFCAVIILRDFSAVGSFLAFSVVVAAIFGVLALIRATCRMLVDESRVTGIA